MPKLGSDITNVNSWQVPEYQLFEFKKRTSKYCICIPVINEGERIKNQLKRMKRYSKIIDILILDGGSTDDSMEKAFLRRNGVRVLLVKKSFGRQSTQLRMGLAYALKQGYEGIVIVDGNGKDGVEVIPDFIRKLKEGYDYVQGSRFAKGGQAINTPPLRWIGNRFIISPILSLPARFWFTDVTNGFRACSRKYLLHPKVQPFRDIFIKYELLFYLPVRANQIGLKVTEIPVVRKYPKDEIPTKITSIRGHLDLFVTVLKVAFGYCNPN